MFHNRTFKVLSNLMLLVVFSASRVAAAPNNSANNTFVSGNLPSARAQDAGLETRQLIDNNQSESNSKIGIVLPNEVADSFRFPLDGQWKIMLDFGEYNKPRFQGKHLGEDVKAAADAPLYAVANGLVKANSYHKDYMNVVIIEHTLPDNSKVTSVYGHMKADGIIAVGTQVQIGQPIGYLDTAASFLANHYVQHEHFGIRKGGYSSTWVYYGYELGSETTTNWYDPSDFILSHQGGGTSLCSAPSNGSPRDNNILNKNQVAFSWDPPYCNGLDYYTLRVSNNANIDNQPFINERVDKNAASISLNIPSQYNGQTLYWDIKPHNGAGYGSKGGPWTFKIDTSTTQSGETFPKYTWNVQYFRNKELTDQCITSSFDRTFIFQDWGDGAPASGCNSDNWGASFTRRVNFQGGDYTFGLKADDWGRIYVDNNLVVDKWNGASQVKEGRTLSSGDHDIKVEFADTMGGAKLSAWWWGPGFNVPHETQDTNQWYANYWLNPDLWQDSFASVNEGTGILNHNEQKDWTNGSPGWDMPADGFSAKFERTVNFECGLYQFTLDQDDGARFWLDGVLKVDRWTGPTGSYQFDLPITRGPHTLQVDYNENGGEAHISFDWQSLSGCNPSAPALQSPSNSSSLAWNADLSPQWNPSSGATQYYVNIKGGSGVDINSDWISETQWPIGGLWPGVYTWTVSSRNDYGSSSPSEPWTFTVEEAQVQAVPSPNFNASPLSGIAPFTTTFHILDTTNITSCSWDYGDGQTSTTCTQSHDHIYNNSGTYSVSLTVSGVGGEDSMTRTDYITVLPNDHGNQTLTVNKNGAGSGVVISVPNGISCGSTCSYVFAYNTVVTLNAAPNSLSTFGSWSGGGCSGGGTCTVTMSSAQSVTATFNTTDNQTLTVSKNGTGSGTVTSSPSGINCGATCSYAFANNAVVTLTATPTSPSTFGGWSGGGCSGTGTCTVTLTAATSVTASFSDTTARSASITLTSPIPNPILIGGNVAFDLVFSVANINPGVGGAEIYLSYNPVLVSLSKTQGSQGFFDAANVSINEVLPAEKCPGGASPCVHLVLAGSPQTTKTGIAVRFQFNGTAQGTACFAVAGSKMVDANGFDVPFDAAPEQCVTVNPSAKAVSVILRQGVPANPNPSGVSNLACSSVTVSGTGIFGPLNTDANGAFNFASLPSGTYTFRAVYPGYLVSEKTGVSVINPSTIDVGTTNLRGGDANNDNAINILDIGTILSKFGQAGVAVKSANCSDPDEAADINNDGLVNISDLAITAGNWGSVGPTLWP